MGLKTISEQFREDVLRLNLQTPSEIVVNLANSDGTLFYSAYKEQQGQDAVVHRYSVVDAGNVTDIGNDIRKQLFQKNLQTTTDIVAGLEDLSPNKSETARYIDSIGSDAPINWLGEVKDVGTVDTEADTARQTNLSKNKPIDVSDPSESNQFVTGEGYNYMSLLQTIGSPAKINDFTIHNVESISSPNNVMQNSEEKLHLRLNKYIPDEYSAANVRDDILKTVYDKTTYVKENTNGLSSVTPSDYAYRDFYNLNNNATLPQVVNQEAVVLQSDTLMANIGAMMLQFNLQQRFEQNLYNETLGKIDLINYNPNGTMPAELDPLELIKFAKDPLNNTIQKNYTITVPRNFVGKTAQFLLGLEGIISPFDLWESVQVSGRDLTPTTIPNIEQMTALSGATQSVAKNDDDLLRKTGGGQRWALYENLNMNKYSPKFDTRAEFIGFQKKPKGLYYLGSEDSPPISLLQAYDVQVNSTEELRKAFDPNDPGGLDRTQLKNEDIIWTNMTDYYAEAGEVLTAEENNFIMSTATSYEYSNLREGSLLDVTQRLMNIGRGSSPIRNLKRAFKDDQLVYSKGSAVRRIDIKTGTTGNSYKVADPSVDSSAFERTWTKARPYNTINRLMKYSELIRRERNSVLDQNANYNIFPSKLNVGTLYDQQTLNKDGIRDRFADKNFDKFRARKYMFSIENLAWKESAQFNDLPAYEQGSNGGRVMWFPPYGLTFNENSKPNWTTHEFLGRPEPIYTYNNTERSGNLSFMIVVDHPSILNLLVQKELASITDEKDVDHILNSFFAGIKSAQFDIFELARIWGVFSNEDLAFFKGVLDGNYEYPINITNGKKIDYNYKKAQDTKTDPNDKKANEIKKELETLKMFFANDKPSGDAVFDDLYNTYYGWLTGTGGTDSGSMGCQYDYSRYIGINAPKKYFLIDDVTKGVQEGINIAVEYKKCTDAFSRLRSYIEKDLPADSFVDIQIDAYASTIATADYNHKLAKRRAKSVANWIAKELGLSINDASTKDTDTEYEIALVGTTNSSKEVVKIRGLFDGANFKERSTDNMYQDISWGTAFDGTKPICYRNESGDDVTIPSTKAEYFDGTSCGESGESERGVTYSVLSYPAAYARRVVLRVEVPTLPITTTTVTEEKTTLETPAEIIVRKVEISNLINKRDIATRILNKLITENEYFEYLDETSPTVFSSLKEKLKYFSPAFHSMTPEGLNGRLTFLQQCVRPGDTVKVNSCTDSNVINLTFGRPPVCILRIGDFFNTKMIIDNLQIDYATVGGNVTYDLNPEGIGVQPMIAKVDLSVKYIGGMGLREPVLELQNALSFNYYANADVYESMSYGQTNLDERYLENLELAYNSTKLDIQKLNIAQLEKIDPNTQVTFKHLGDINYTYPPLNPSDGAAYIDAHKIKDGLDIVQYYNMDYHLLFGGMYTAYDQYMKSYYSLMKDYLDNIDNPYDVMWLFFGNFVHSTEFGKKKEGDQFLTPEIIYPDIRQNSLLWQKNNYFAIGYDSYQKSNNYASLKLNLYPQVLNNRILDAQTYHIQDFAGVLAPHYFDVDYISQNMQVYKDTFIKYLNCEEWIIFTPQVLSRFKLLNETSKKAFRDYMLNEFNKYYDEMLLQMALKLDNNFEYFKDFYSNTLSVNCVCNGVDGGTSEVGIRYLEVAPNVNPTGMTVDLKIFGKTNSAPDDPLNAFPFPIEFVNGYVNAYGDINALADNGERGFFNYLKQQITNSTMQSGHMPYYDFGSNQWKIDSTPTTEAMATMFEKINHEFLYFGNLTSRVCINDVFAPEIKYMNVRDAVKDISSYEESHKYRVQLILGLGSDISYIYKEYSYGGFDSTLSSNEYKLQGIPFENVIFLNFVNKFFATTEPLALCNLAVRYTAKNNLTEQAAIDQFFIAINNTGFRAFYALKPSVDDNIDRYAALLSTTISDNKPILDMIQKQSVNVSTEQYTLKMFETEANRVSSYGRLALDNYYKFVKTY